jgi:succinate dehydrogenase / fumarate reductase, flavoprotein subunit
MAETYFAGGSMHGDLALVEASLSARAFLHLVNLGVPFPATPTGSSSATRPTTIRASAPPRSARTPRARCAAR